ncbi:NAD(P)/FAD-dependent oxidoreductase [Burkholderia gladioli]|uniref:NAD(P)/FAD-dependent oxidoreductase n=1 Tax=Burkholderia gladioli TaxID=28095 RepID=UPI0009B810F7|nr:FAD-dependent oxidoreductase [Burkholderia gladioli]
MNDLTLMIVGGGIIGHMVAWKACLSNPGITITLVERNLPGSGASARSAGLHFPLSRTSAGREYSLRSQQFYQSALRQLPSLPIDMLDLRIHCEAGQEAELREAMTAGAGLNRVPELEDGAGALGSHLPVWSATGANRADVRGLVIEIRRMLAGRLRILDGLQVDSITERRSGVELRTRDGAQLEADRLVLAPGPWVFDDAFRPYTGALGIRVKRVVAFHIEEAVPRTAVDLFFRADAFLMPRLGGGTLFSFTRNEWDVSPETSGQGISAADRAEAEGVLTQLAPALSVRLSGAQAFCDAYSHDRVPIATVLGDTGRIAFAGAANGSGYRFAPVIAERALAALGLDWDGQAGASTATVESA